MKTLGLIIAGYSKPHRFVAPIKDYEDMDDGRAWTTYRDNSNHFDDIYDIVWFDPADAISTLGGDAYYKIPADCLDYVGWKECTL